MNTHLNNFRVDRKWTVIDLIRSCKCSAKFQGYNIVRTGVLSISPWTVVICFLFFFFNTTKLFNKNQCNNKI